MHINILRKSFLCRSAGLSTALAAATLGLAMTPKNASAQNSVYTLNINSATPVGFSSTGGAVRFTYELTQGVAVATLGSSFDIDYVWSAPTPTDSTYSHRWQTTPSTFSLPNGLYGYSLTGPSFNTANLPTSNESDEAGVSGLTSGSSYAARQTQFQDWIADGDLQWLGTFSLTPTPLTSAQYSGYQLVSEGYATASGNYLHTDTTGSGDYDAGFHAEKITSPGLSHTQTTQWRYTAFSENGGFNNNLDTGTPERVAMGSLDRATYVFTQQIPEPDGIILLGLAVTIPLLRRRRSA